MTWVLIFATTVAAGWLAARGLTAGTWSGPRWATLLFELGLGALFGPGLASILYFALLVMGIASRGTAAGACAVLLGASALLFWRRRSRQAELSPDPEKRGSFPWTWALWIAVAAAAVFFILDFQTASSANPAGEWDAMSIWNLRAHDLASGPDLWRRAVSTELGGNMAGAAHPGYPLFLSGFIGLQWLASGSFDEAVPIAASLLFALGALMILGASLASRRSVALGLLAWLILLASEVFASQAATQYSDLLQGLGFLSALALLEAAWEHKSDRRLLAAAGLAIGLSCWIKNEGLPFTLAALLVAAWRFWPLLSELIWLSVGAAPGLLATAVLKLFVAHGSEAVFPHTFGEAVQKIAGPGRWWQAALGFGKAVYDAGNLWTHPVLLAAVLALALRFVPGAEWRRRVWLAVPIAATAAAEYGLYLVTTADLNWHISTSVSRLVAQMWPSLIWLLFMVLRAPEDAFEPLPEKVPAPNAQAMRAAAGGKRKRR